MSGYEPLRPVGNTPEALFDQAVHDKTHGPEGRLRSSSTVKVQRTTRGIFLKAIVPRGGTSATPSGVSEFILLKVYGDYLLCQTNNASATHTLIAKPQRLRNSIASLWLYGTKFNFSYPHNPLDPVHPPVPPDPFAYIKRAALPQGSSATPEYQLYTPPYVPQNNSQPQTGELIYAMPILNSTLHVGPDDSGTAGGTLVTWLEISGRIWSRAYNQVA